MKKIVKKVIKLIFTILFLPVIFFIRLISPILNIRFGKIFASRLGHLAFEIELYLCEKDHGLHKNVLDIFYYNRETVANKNLLNMWKGHIKILPPVFLPLIWANDLIPDFQKFKIPLSTDQHDDQLGLFNLYSRHLKFTTKQEESLLHTLSKMGVEKYDQFITLHTRDSNYLKTLNNIESDLHHNYRDANIELYIPAVQKLINQNIFLFRVGVVVNKQIFINNAKFFDCTGNKRDELLELFLISKSKFFISTNSGPCAIATVFRVPNAFVNVAPILGVKGISTHMDMFIHKKYWSLIYNRYLSLDEIFKMGASNFTDENLFIKNNILLHENSENEIVDFTQEMNKKIDGCWIESEDEFNLVEKYEIVLRKWNVNPKSMPKVSYTFLKSNLYLVEHSNN